MSGRDPRDSVFVPGIFKAKAINPREWRDSFDPPLGMPSIAAVDIIANLVHLQAKKDDRNFEAFVEMIINALQQAGKVEEAMAIMVARRGAIAREPAKAEPRLGPDGQAVEGNAAIEVPSELASFLYEIKPSLALEDMVLAPEVEQRAREFLRDAGKSAELQAWGLAPVNRLLMYGPPGDGKTTLAGALAAGLKLPFFVLRLAGLTTGLHGQAENNIAQALRWAAQHALVLFLDEVDSLLQRRGTAGINSKMHDDSTNTFLTALDELPPSVYVFAATNRPQVLDPAAVRRFEVHLELPAPGAEALGRWFTLWLERLAKKAGVAGGKKGKRVKGGEPAKLPASALCAALTAEEVGLAAAARGLSFATLEGACTQALRGHICELPESSLDKHLRLALGIEEAAGE